MEWKNVSAEGNSTGKGPEVGNSMVHLKQEDTNPEWMEQKEHGDYGLERGGPPSSPRRLFFFFLIYFCLCWVTVPAQGFSLVARSGGDSLVVLGLLKRWLLLLRNMGSRAHRLSNCNPWAQ